MFRQCRGIPQGSVVSSLLCCLCYGHMENVLFKDITANGGCLMRLVDDFLFITPDLRQAQIFLKTLLAGVPKYGCVVNPQKVAFNFPLSETQRFTPGTNSLEAVYKNIYKLVLLHACRFHVCAQSLPFGQKVSRNPGFFLQLIWDMAEYTNRLIRISNRGMVLGNKAQTGCMQYEAVELIYCLSFLLVLSRHRPLYLGLIPPLHTRKRHLERKLGDLRLMRVRQAATPKVTEDLMAIRA